MIIKIIIKIIIYPTNQLKQNKQNDIRYTFNTNLHMNIFTTWSLGDLEVGKLMEVNGP